MPGRGPAPKDPKRRARTNADPIPTTQLEFRRGVPPELPETVDWHPQTLRWWEVWTNSAQTTIMTDVDWQYMLITAMLVNQFWNRAHWTLAAEIRLREAKMAATPEDRARLRIQLVEADAAEGNSRPWHDEAPASKQRYGELRALPGAATGTES